MGHGPCNKAIRFQLGWNDIPKRTKHLSNAPGILKMSSTFWVGRSRLKKKTFDLHQVSQYVRESWLYLHKYLILCKGLARIFTPADHYQHPEQKCLWNGMPGSITKQLGNLIIPNSPNIYEITISSSKGPYISCMNCPRQIPSRHPHSVYT